MSLNSASQFDETLVTTATEFAAQDEVLANSPVLSADVNTIAERVLRRTRGLYEGGPYPTGITITQSGTNGNGLVATANGSGTGVVITGGSSDGLGGYFQGGVINGRGIEVYGAGTGSGAVIQGGASGIGLEVSAGGGNTNGIEAYATGSGYALTCEVGGIQFNGTQPTSTADPGANAAHGTNQVKVFAHITTTGLGSTAGDISLVDGYNVASVAINTGNGITITFARAFASADYAAHVTNYDGTALFGVTDYSLSAAGSVRVKIFDHAGVLQQPESVALRIGVTICGRQ